jgi:MazG family protein
MPRTGKKFEEFVGIVKALREKCPWDRVQTFESLKPYLVEEVYEAIQAIDDKNYKRLSEELGDMLLHVVMLANMARGFSIEDVIETISKKMIRRHPHVFGKIKAKNADEVLARWERIKQEEKEEKEKEKAKGKRHKGILESIPQSLPALYRADKVQRRAARLGFDWDRVAGAWEKVHEELDEIHDLLKVESPSTSFGASRKSKVVSRRIKEEIGDLLFAIVNVARKLNLDAEEALQQANTKFMRRFSKIEKKLQKKKMSLAEMDALWDKIKALEG